MTSKIRFLHTADFHMGAPMRGFRDLTDAWGTRLQRAIPEAFDRVVETALSNKVDFVIIAGDMFDTSRASYGDFLRFFEGMQQFDDVGIPVYLTTGNHDPFTSWKDNIDRLPSSCHMLGMDGPEFALYERNGEPLCLIGARGYRNQAWPTSEPIARDIDRAHAVEALRAKHPRAAQAPFTIGVIHAGFDPDQSKAYSDPAALLQANVDVWACGHLHKRNLVPSESHPRIVFPGCIQGRDLKEEGERGCYLVTLEKANAYARAEVKLEFVPTASVVFHIAKVDVSVCQTLADVASLIQAQLFQENGKASCDEMVERVILQGQTDLHEFLRRPEVLQDLRRRVNNAYPSFFCDAIVDKTRSPRDSAALLREGLFEAHTVRVAAEQRRDSAQTINYVQAEFVKRGIDVPTALVELMDDFNDAAESLVLDLLEEDRV